MPTGRTLTREELLAVLADLKGDLRDDLRVIRDHLADLNGRTRKGEVADAEVRTQIGYLQAQLAAHEDRAAAARTPGAEAHVLSTKAQAALVGSAVLVITGVFKLVGVLASVVSAKAFELLVRK